MKHSARHHASAPSTSAEPACQTILNDALRHLDAGQPEQALCLLRRSKLESDAVRNARGVCLIRLGRLDNAVQLFRSLVLPPGCTWMKPDLPVIFRTNFATALLLAGRPAGCLSALLEMEEADHPSVVRLLGMLERWERSLSWRNWLAWKVGLEPSVPVTLDFTPGEVFDPSLIPNHTPPREQPMGRAA